MKHVPGNIAHVGMMVAANRMPLLQTLPRIRHRIYTLTFAKL